MVQNLISGFERGKLRLNAYMILRFASAPKVFIDVPLPHDSAKLKMPSRKVLRRLEPIEARSVARQTARLHTIKTFLEGAAAL